MVCPHVQPHACYPSSDHLSHHQTIVASPAHMTYPLVSTWSWWFPAGPIYHVPQKDWIAPPHTETAVGPKVVRGILPAHKTTFPRLLISAHLSPRSPSYLPDHNLAAHTCLTRFYLIFPANASSSLIHVIEQPSLVPVAIMSLPFYLCT